MWRGLPGGESCGAERRQWGGVLNLVYEESRLRRRTRHSVVATCDIDLRCMLFSFSIEMFNVDTTIQLLSFIIHDDHNPEEEIKKNHHSLNY